MIHLATGFDHDRWASGLWLECLERKGRIDPDWAILSHIYSAHLVWVERTEGNSLASLPSVDLTLELIDEIDERWKAQLLRPNDVIEYKRTTGEVLRQPLFDIAAHVLDHATYHRGELRGLCRARSDDDFPETGMQMFLTKIRG